MGFSIGRLVKWLALNKPILVGRVAVAAVLISLGSTSYTAAHANVHGHQDTMPALHQ